MAYYPKLVAFPLSEFAAAHFPHEGLCTFQSDFDFCLFHAVEVCLLLSETPRKGSKFTQKT